MIDFSTLARKSGYLCFDVEFDARKYSLFKPGFRLHGCGFSTFDESGEIVAEYITDWDRARQIIYDCFPQDIQIVAHNAKFDLNCLKILGAYPCDPKIRCTMVALNVLDENLDPKQIGLKPTILREYGHKMEEYAEAAKLGMDHPQFQKYAVDDAYWELRLYKDLEPKLVPYKDYYEKILMPSLICFSDVEVFGLHWDLDASDDFYRKLFHARKKLESRIHAKIGRLNLDSNPQLSRRLFNELGYSTQYTERGKSGEYSLSAEVLDMMASKYEVCNWIRAYRSCQKLISSYVEPIQRQVHENFDNRIHSTYWLTSLTGRVRCSEVNNQNFPVKVGDKLGELSSIFEDVKIRQACTTAQGKKLIVTDFSQIELRLAGPVMGEPGFIDPYCTWKCHACGESGYSRKIEHSCPNCGQPENEAEFKEGKGFWQGEDLHLDILRHIPPELRKRLTRSDGKTLNFAILYNATCWRLHYSQPRLSPDEWQKVLDAVMKHRPKARAFHASSERILLTKGYREDCFGRVRRIPADQYTVKGRIDPKRFKHCLNEFINFPIQSPGSTLCQLAMVKLRKCWMDKGWWGTRAKIVNMIHDEIVSEVDEDIAQEALADQIYWMENAAEFIVPIRATGGIYENWAQAK